MSHLAGVAGFEPTNDGVRVRCLTAWRYPYMAPEAGFEPATSWLTVTRSTGWAIQEYIATSFRMVTNNGAENGTRTRDPNLGKVVLYHWATSACAFATITLYHCLAICQVSFFNQWFRRSDASSSWTVFYHAVRFVSIGIFIRIYRSFRCLSGSLRRV